MEDVRPLRLDQPAVGAEDVGELEGPEVVELGPRQQPVDDLIAARLLRHLSGSGSTSSGRGQDADARRDRRGG